VYEILGILVGLLGGIIILGGDAKVAQVANGRNRMFAEPDGRLLLDGIPGCSIVPLTTSGTAPFVAVAREELRGNVSVRLVGRSNGRYSHLVARRSWSYSVEGRIAEGAEDSIEVHASDGGFPKLVLATNETRKVLDVTYSICDSPEQQRLVQYTMSVPAAAGAETCIQAERGRGGIVISSNAGPIRTELTIHVKERGRHAVGRIARVTGPADGGVIHVRPLDLVRVEGEAVIDTLDAPGGSVSTTEVVDVVRG
jgi:hypothetical protein